MSKRKLDADTLKQAGLSIPFVGPDNRAGAKAVGEVLAKKLKHFARKHEFRALQSLKSFAQRLKMKPLELQQQRTHLLRQSVNKQSHHFAMKSVHLQLNSHQRLWAKLLRIKLVNHESLIVF